MPDNDQTYGGYENGLDWITDLAIEDFQLSKKGINKKGVFNDKKPKPLDPRSDPGSSDL